MNYITRLCLLVTLLVGSLTCISAFAPATSFVSTRSTIVGSRLQAIPETTFQDVPMSLSAATLDPSSFLSDLLGGVLGTPVILAIPIVAALLVASLIAFFIISYANPAEEDE